MNAPFDTRALVVDAALTDVENLVHVVARLAANVKTAAAETADPYVRTILAELLDDAEGLRVIGVEIAGHVRSLGFAC